MRYIPHAILIALVLILPLILSLTLAAVAFASYTAVVLVTMHVYFPELDLSVAEAATLAAKDIGKLLAF